ncbi:MAG: tyrosine-type recombinase/integrase [Chloroflexi bacterium]|nr:tyrosine-type recombinase/integrase [Chloroflexota bacterium]
MSLNLEFSSSLAPVITRYLNLNTALGRCFSGERATLRSLDSALVANEAEDLTLDSFLHWTSSLVHLKSGVRRNRMRVVRNLCLYRRRTEPACFVPDQALFPPPHQYVQPYIFNEKEIAQLIDTTGTLLTTRAYPLRSPVFRLGIGLLYTTGLRRGELLRIRLGDYDPMAQTLLVRPSKFHKSRLLPLSLDMAQEIKRYFAARRAHRPETMTPEAPLFWNGSSVLRSYTGTGLCRVFHALLQRTDIRKPDGQLPRVHDVRHSFAMNVLLRWYRSGIDVHAKLPLLATYMGHVSVASTQYYLRFIEPLACAASQRFAACYGGLVTPPPKEVCDDGSTS